MNLNRTYATIRRKIGFSGEASMAAIEVVIIDRNPHVREGLRAILGSREDIEVVAAVQTADQATRKLNDASPDVVLVDARVPAGDGGGEIRAARERWPAAELIALAVHSSDTNMAIAAGADRVVMKDSTRRALLDAVRASAGNDDSGSTADS